MRDSWQLGETVRGQMAWALAPGRKGPRGPTGVRLCSRMVSSAAGTVEGGQARERWETDPAAWLRSHAARSVSPVRGWEGVQIGTRPGASVCLLAQACTAQHVTLSILPSLDLLGLLQMEQALSTV